MPITNATLAAGAEEEGGKSSSDRPPVVSWAYPDWRQQAHPSSIIHPKPPHYYDSLSKGLHVGHNLDSFDRHMGQHESESCGKEGVALDAVELNVDLLVGAKCAEDTLKPYEIDVGFYYAEPESALQLESRRLCKKVTDGDIAAGKERWANLVQNLAGGLIGPRHGSEGQDLRSPTSSEFFDLTDSEHSMDSDPGPSTPKPRSYANVTVKQPSPGLQDFSPPRSLNASASSFIPTSSTPVKVPVHFPISRFSRAVPSPSPSPTYPNFTFPSLNAGIQSLPSLPPTLKKDEQGFYTEVPSSPSTDQRSVSNRAQRSSMSLLPPFLADPSRRARKTSRTREIVDQLRSASANCADRPSSRGCVPIRPVSTPHQLTLLGPSSSTADEDTHRLDSDASQPSTSYLRPTAGDFDEDGDGWLRLEVEDTDNDPEAKTRRTRNLMHALGRNRADSTYESDSDVNHRESDWEVFAQPTTEPKKSSKEASSTRRKGTRQRSRKSHGGYRGPSMSSPAAPPPMPLPLSSLAPTQPFFPAYPVYTTPYTYAASPYKPMQMPQTHCFPTHPAYAGSPFGPIPLYPPVIQLPSSASSMNIQGGFDRTGIAGCVGMTRAQW